MASDLALIKGGRCTHNVDMERVVHQSMTFKESQDWDVRQQLAMSAQERIRAARALQQRVYGAAAKDVRACHKKP